MVCKVCENEIGYVLPNRVRELMHQLWIRRSDSDSRSKSEIKYLARVGMLKKIDIPSLSETRQGYQFTMQGTRTIKLFSEIISRHIRERVSREDWKKLTTDEKNNLQTYGNKDGRAI
jgi:hypothetical protein